KNKNMQLPQQTLIYPQNLCGSEVNYDRGPHCWAPAEWPSCTAAGARLVTVFDVAEAAAASLASKAGASVARTAEEALSHPEVTAVLVATSSGTHVKYVVVAG